jgi:hypothetical protein
LDRDKREERTSMYLGSGRSTKRVDMGDIEDYQDGGPDSLLNTLDEDPSVISKAS